ncbi:hypothetical protein ABPG75_001747 [Micractinium tetrahymenae]
MGFLHHALDGSALADIARGRTLAAGAGSGAQGPPLQQQQHRQQQEQQAGQLGPFSRPDDDVRRGVVKLYAQLRKEYAEQQQQKAAEAAAANAAALRRDLAAQEEALEAALQGSPAAELIARLGGLPVATERGTGAAAFAEARSAAARWQQPRPQQAAVSEGSGPAGSSSTVASGANPGGLGEAEQAQQVVADPTSTRPVPTQPLAATKGALNYVGGIRMPLQAFVLPAIKAVPPYKTWIHVQHNVLSREIGKRMFYTDEKGETVPVSEDEADAEAKLDRALNGIYRQQHESILQQVVAQYGTGLAVFEALGEKMHVSAGALEARALALAAEAAGLAPAQRTVPWEDKQELDCLEVDMHAVWCRRCRAFGCRIHKGGHVRPVLGPIKEQQKGVWLPAVDRKQQQQQQEGQQQHDQQQQRQRERGRESDLEPCGAHCYLGPRQGGEQLPAAAAQPMAGQQQNDSASHASSPVPVPGSGLLSLKRRRSDAKQQQDPAVPGRQQQPACAGEQEVNSPPAKQLRRGSGNASDQGTASGSHQAARAATAAAAAAAVAAAGNVPARRRRSRATDAQEAGGSDDEPWGAWEEALLQQGLEVWGRQPCQVAVMVGTRTCRQVHQRMLELASSSGSAGEGQDRQQPRRAKGRKMAKAQVKARKPMAVYERTKRSTNEKWPQYVPCDCQGACKADCPCAGDANFCEKFCGCDPAKCGNRFPGCTCKCGNTLGRRCSSKHCPCLAAGRECDPDLCKSCKPTLSGMHQEGWQCNNFHIRLGQKKRVLMGLSDVQGWGAFLQQGVQKDEFVGEYCGELIDHQEADRRGIVYDRDDNSYLFDLNKDWVIDARQRGNTLRFANHSTTASCRAQILMVDGDHRVAIMANRDMDAAAELTYDYMYDKRVAPDWAVTEQEWRRAAQAAAKKHATRQRHGALSGDGTPPAAEPVLSEQPGRRVHPFHEAAPLELHFANISLPSPAPPFLYASILQDDDSYQVRNESIRALEPGLTASWLHKAGACCKRGGHVLDVGSHFGYYALLGASMGCKFAAVEPVPLFRAILELNIHVNPALAGVGSVLPYAVGLENKSIQMQVPTHGSFGTAHVADDDAAPGGVGLVAVEQRRLDDMLEGVLGGAEVCMLKIDVEGREPSVVMSAHKLFAGPSKPREIMLEFSPGFTKEGLAEMLQTLHGYGYVARGVDWGHVRIEKPVSAIDVRDWFQGTLDISTDEARQRLIDGIAINENIFFWLPSPSPA